MVGMRGFEGGFLSLQVFFLFGGADSAVDVLDPAVLFMLWFRKEVSVVSSRSLDPLELSFLEPASQCNVADVVLTDQVTWSSVHVDAVTEVIVFLL
jgi:hypothetical protein